MDATFTEVLARAREWIEAGKSPNGDKPMVLATADEHGFPDARWVLLKEVDATGFVFYTNTRSAKGQQLRLRPQATLAFFWPALGKQLRIAGTVEEVPKELADAYWRTRPRESQLAAIASNQSAPLESREELLKRHAALAVEWEGKDIPRPAHWSGYRVHPLKVEFWTNGDHRLHHREQFTPSGTGDTWKGTLLNP